MISEDVYKKVRLNRSQVTKAAAAPKDGKAPADTTPTPPGIPPVPNGAAGGANK